MADKEVKRIQLSRSAYIEESRSIAIIRLNEHYFLEGEPVIINYYKEPDIRTDIGTIVAVGVHEGAGVNNYRIITTGQTIVVRKVVTDPADISSLVHKELYVLHNPEDNLWYYVYMKDGEISRTIQLIPEDEAIFLESETGYRWFYHKQECRREDDFFSKKEVVDAINTVKNEDAYLSVVPVTGTIFKIGDVKNIMFKIHNYRLDGTDVSDKCTYYVNNEKITRDEYGNWTATSINKDTKFTFKAEFELFADFVIYYTKTIYVRFGHYTYYGLVYDGWTPTPENVESLSHRELHCQENIGLKKLSLNYQKIAFAYPKVFGPISHIYDTHRNDYIYDYDVFGTELENQIIINREPYLVYLKKDPVTISDFDQEFVLEFTSPIEVDNGTNSHVEELYNAWRNRNTSEGILQLDENGKIPEEVMQNTITNAVVFLENIQEEIPTSATKAGLSYYVSSIGKIYTSKSTDEFYSYIPNDSVIYVNRADTSEYYWTGRQLLPITDNLSIKEVTDLTEIL